MIGILLNKSSKYGDRLDCAKYLGDYVEEDAESALLVVACNAAENEDFVEDCSEALARMWIKRGRVNHEYLSKLPTRARQVAQAVLDSQES